MKIDKWIIEEMNKKSTDFLNNRLKNVLAEIEFLENIYMGDGKFHLFSKEFGDAAHTERQNLCQISSLLFSILRERNIDVDLIHRQKYLISILE